jgi:hypothetical protein
MPPELDYEEILRTVGAWLDTAAYDLVILDVSLQAVPIETVGPSVSDRFELPEIAQHARVQRMLRGRGPVETESGGRPRLEHVLRVVGAELDRAGESRYGITVSGGRVLVTGAEGYYREFDSETLAWLLQQATRCPDGSGADTCGAHGR